MLRKDAGKFAKPLGFAYIIVQFVGGFSGALLVFMWNKDGGHFGVENTKYIFQACLAETFSGFVYIFTFLIQTEQSTRFSNDPAIWSLLIAAAYTAALFFNVRRSPAVNPAIAFGFYMTMLIDHGGSGFIKYIWIHLIFP